MIDNVDQVAKQVKLEHNVDVKPWLIKSVMREAGLRYTKIIRAPILGNSDRSMVLRMQFSLKYLHLPLDKRIIVLDESWIGHHQFKRNSWQVKGKANSVPAYSQVPRVTLITACDSLGNIYLSAA